MEIASVSWKLFELDFSIRYEFTSDYFAHILFDPELCAEDN